MTVTGTEGRADVCAACEVVWRQKIIAAAKDATAIPAMIKKICRESRPVIRIPMGVAIASFPNRSNRDLTDFRAFVRHRRGAPDYTGLGMSSALNLIKIAPPFH
jgi:hypothetical protein